MEKKMETAIEGSGFRVLPFLLGRVRTRGIRWNKLGPPVLGSLAME